MQIPDFLIKKINNEYNEEICKKIKWACFKKASYF